MPKNLNPVNSSQTMVIPSRDGALAQLESFLERVPSYEKNRSYDRPGHADVSQLSRWIRYRVVTEGECIERVLSRYPFAMAEKFIQEVVWRTYWKGWLEMHPGVWARFVSDRERLIERYRDDEGLHAAYAGRTSLIFFNDWVRELIDTGYLHNHTRMWFASVWIFTLRLPWQLGAAFMYRHLLDGDPASNTLSWRWVGGLHTRGKIYVAKPGNIRTYSEGRWNPKEGELAVDPAPLPFEEPDGVAPFRKVEALSPSSDSLV
ncbi:MAG: Deoxyribodipyrimidine photo-lyase, partial [Pseudomonadota bacterium]